MRAYLALAVVFAACTTTGTITAIDDPDTTGTPTTPTTSGPNGGASVDIPGPVTVAAPEEVYQGRYRLQSYFDVAGSGVLGPTISGTLVDLSNFHDDPAGTILDLMALYNVPYISEVWDVLPGAIQDKFSGWLDDLIFQPLFQGVPAIDKAVQIVDDIATVSRNVEVDTDLVLRPPGSTGRVRGTQELKALAFTLWGNRGEIPIPSALSSLAVAQARGQLTATPDAPLTQAQGHLALERASFSIPYGDMLMDFIKQQIFEPAGASDLASYLNVLLDCNSIGSSIGGMCVLGVCVDDFVSDSTLQSFCSDGLNLVGFVVETGVRSLKFDLLDLKQGTCDLYDVGYGDTTGDYKIDAIANGTWDASITVGATTYPMSAWFEGHRIGDN